MIMMHYHGQGRSEYHQELSSAEENEDLLMSGISTPNVDNCDENDTADLHVQTENDHTVETTVSSMQRIFDIEDRLFKSTYDSLKHKIDDAVKGNKLDRIVKEIKEKPHIKTMKDHLGRTFLHVAVEQSDLNFVQCLLHTGFNPNVKEKCGATPLIIAIIQKSKEICQLLVNARASVRGPLFTNVPSPVSIAKNMDLAEILDILQPTRSDEEDADLQLYDPIFSCSNSDMNLHTTEETSGTCKRSFPGFLTGVVGDIGTCKTNRGVMSRSASHQWVGIIPGDMHTKGYLAEACFKEQGCGGFHHLVQKVMKPPKLTKEAFKKKKFAEGNLDRIKEAVQDGARAYGLAAVMLFKKSELYPDTDMLSKCYRATGSHTEVLLKQFKLWMEKSSMASPSFKYRSRMFAYYGPLLELYNLANSHCWGQARETVFLQQLPTYAQLNFPNYYTECFIHAVNLLGKWPLAFRKIVGQNSSVNITGKAGSGIEMDAFVEAEIVQPLKKYVSGHTSVKMCQRLMGSIDLFKMTRAAYTAKEAFDVHSTSIHSVPDCFRDQLKGARFCLQKELLLPSEAEDDVPKCLLVDGKGGKEGKEGKVSKCFLEVQEKGCKKITDNFETKLYECFPDLRYQLLLD